MEEAIYRKNKSGEVEKINPKTTQLEEIERELKEKDTVVNKLKGVAGSIGNEITDISQGGKRIGKRASTLSDKMEEIESLKSQKRRLTTETDPEIKRETRGMKKGGKVKSASARADGCAQRGKTRGKMI